MDINKLPIFSMIAKRMAWLSERQRVLAHNIANADTPGYKPKDLRPLNFREVLKGNLRNVNLRVTNPAHIAAGKSKSARGDATIYRAMKMDEPYGMDISGNAVSLEQQLIKVSETVMNYELMTNLYKKNVAMIKEAIGRGRG